MQDFFIILLFKSGCWINNIVINIGCCIEHRVLISQNITSYKLYYYSSSQSIASKFIGNQSGQQTKSLYNTLVVWNKPLPGRTIVVRNKPQKETNSLLFWRRWSYCKKMSAPPSSILNMFMTVSPYCTVYLQQKISLFKSV